jgi:thioredoxin 2
MGDTKHVVCSDCSKINRIATSRMGDHPRCGACKRPLFPGVPIPLDDATFDRFVALNEVPVVVDFWASWCGPCKIMAPAYANAAADLAPEILLAKLDTEKAPQTATRLGIRSIPTLVMFQQGREVARQTGAMSQPQIDQWVRSKVA